MAAQPLPRYLQGAAWSEAEEGLSLYWTSMVEELEMDWIIAVKVGVEIVGMTDGHRLRHHGNGQLLEDRPIAIRSSGFQAEHEKPPRQPTPPPDLRGDAHGRLQTAGPEAEGGTGGPRKKGVVKGTRRCRPLRSCL